MFPSTDWHYVSDDLISALTRVVFLVHAVRAPHNDVVRPPRKLLDVGAVVGKGDGAPIVANARAVNVRNLLEVLKDIIKIVYIAHHVIVQSGNGAN